MADLSYWKIKREVSEYYDRIARIYNALYGYEQDLKIRKILKNTNIKIGENILDLGCGTGLLFKYIANTSGFIVGVDISLGILKNAKKLAGKGHLDAVHLVRADADFLPFKDNIFDKVFAITLLQNMPEPQLTLKEIIRVARKTSEIIVTGLKKAFTKEEFLKILKDSGLSFLLVDTGEDVKCHIAICSKGKALCQLKI